MKHFSVIQKDFIKAALEFKKRTLPKDESVFSYENIADEMWNDVWTKAKDHFNTGFDLENNDPMKGQKRVITIQKKEDDFTHDHKFNCELWVAGGDWEQSSLYFKCQMKDGSFYQNEDNNKELPYPGNIGKFGDSHFILIPPKEAGNNHLRQFTNNEGKEVWGAYDNNEINDKEIEDLDERAAWKWIENYLYKLVEDYYNYRKSDATIS